jgi:predicted nucleic acid-binding Zn ribbon protein
MFCSNCGVKIENDAKFCSSCGTAVSGKSTVKDKQSDNKANIVMITFPIFPGQVFFTDCHIYRNGQEIASGKQGMTVELQCDEPYEIEVKAGGFFGVAKAKISPGEKYRVDTRGFGKIFLSKVDTIIGPSVFKSPW